LYILYLFSIRKFSVPRTTILLHITRAKRPRSILTVRSITQVHINVLASCTTCLFMKIFQRTLSLVLRESVSRLAGAKVRLFFEPPKLFEFFLRYSCRFFSCLDYHQIIDIITPSNIYTRVNLKSLIESALDIGGNSSYTKSVLVFWI